jgi:hypothetical protein
MIASSLITSSILGDSSIPNKLPLVEVVGQGTTKIGEAYTVEVSLTNPNDDDKVDIWKCYVEIDTENISEEELQYIDITKERAEITNFESGAEVTVELIITFTEDAPEGVYMIPIRISGRWIACTSGCAPFQPQYVNAKVTLLVLKPMITILLAEDFSVRGGERLEIPFTIKNIGTAETSDLSVNYLVDDIFLGNITLPDVPQEVNASTALAETIILDTEGIPYGNYSLAIQTEHTTRKNEVKTDKKSSTIHILGPSDEDITQEKLAEAEATEKEAEILLSQDEFSSALGKYKEAKGLYEEIRIDTKVTEMNDKINLIDGTLQKIQQDTEKADEEFQRGEEYLYDDAYDQALEKTKSARTLYNNLLSLTKDNETYKIVYEEKIAECDERIAYLENKIASETESLPLPEMPSLNTVFVGAIIFLLIALVFGVILMRRE